MRKEYTEEQKREFNELGSRIRGFLKKNRISNSTQEYLPLKRAVQYKMIEPERTFEDLIELIVEDDVSPRCSTPDRAKEILLSAVEEFLLDIRLSEEHQVEYDRLKTEEEKAFYVIELIIEEVKNFEE